MNIFNEKTALILLNMQNDFLRDNGALGRSHLHFPYVRTLIERLIKVNNAFSETPEHLVLATNFTLIADNENHPIYPDNIKKTFPFLGRGDLKSGGWGHQLIEELRPVNYEVNTIAYSAFYRTHLDWMLKKLEVKNLVFAGVPSNTAVASSVRDAQLNNYNTYVLSDACSALSEEAHTETMRSLRHLCPVLTCGEILEEMSV